MRWVGMGIASGIMGIIVAAIAQAAFPAVTREMFAVAAAAATTMIFVIMARLAFSPGPVAMAASRDWDGGDAR